MSGKIYIATETFASAFDANMIRKGVTRVREGHILLQHHPMFFTPLDEAAVDYEVEQRGPVEAAQVREEEPEEPQAEEEPEEEHDPEETLRERLEQHTRSQLNAMAEEEGVDSPARMPNKTAVIDALVAIHKP